MISCEQIFPHDSWRKWKCALYGSQEVQSTCHPCIKIEHQGSSLRTASNHQQCCFRLLSLLKAGPFLQKNMKINSLKIDPEKHILMDRGIHAKLCYQRRTFSCPYILILKGIDNLGRFCCYHRFSTKNCPWWFE